MTKQEEKKVLTVTEASKILSVHPSTIRKAIKEKRLKAFKLSLGKNATYRILSEELNKLFVDV